MCMCVFVLLGHWLGVELDGMLHEVIKIDILLLFEKEQFTPNHSHVIPNM